jgi:broad specificity phosphatase PhoE
VDLARRVGAGTGPFDRVVTSRITRTLETAVAMGFAVDEQLAVLSEIEPDARTEAGHHDRWGWEEPFAAFARLVERGGATAGLGRAQAEAWRAVVEAVPEGGKALVISHGSLIEAGAVACFPDADHAAWGPPFGNCEGLRLVYEGDAWTAPELLRVTDPPASGGRGCARRGVSVRCAAAGHRA